jgi:hypothetical protein
MVIQFVVAPTYNFVVIEHTRMSRLKILSAGHAHIRKFKKIKDEGMQTLILIHVDYVKLRHCWYLRLYRGRPTSFLPVQVLSHVKF